MIASNDASELSEAEVAGLQLFLDAGKTQCLRCHNGPLYSNGGFHNVGTGVGPGRTTGLRQDARAASRVVRPVPL